MERERIRDKNKFQDAQIIKAEQRAATLDEQLKASKQELDSLRRKMAEVRDDQTISDLQAKLKSTEAKLA
jgi:chromosome segregation ATPase